MTRPLTLVLLLVLLAACGVVRPRSMEAAPQEDTFEDDVTSARVLSEEFWKQQFVALGRTYRPVQDFVAYDGENGPMCGDQPSVPNNAFYCPLGHFIAYDARWMRGLWQDMGDGSVYLIIPHEFGHAVQAQLETQFQLNVQQELQADCYAGGTLAALVKSGTLRAEPGDEEELLLNLAAAGDPTEDWFNPQAHGTAEQRQASFAAGYRDGVGGCG
ncbi:neutral zinc metallopeptidase [Nonomuraea typhae]|uniref:neutral zinc metallopeptidase n=1 Tax=Nonomuraea typhae TaxID=2603600 RepID=UPI001FE6D65D|nr:neutral zinc metallopeptidase [Nonomuraea typhae]